MKNSQGQVLYKIISFDNSDGNFTGNPSTMAANIPTRKHAREMLATYRAIKHDGLQFRYIMAKQ